MAKRLIKIAKELNVGTSTIVDHLVNNGFDIENKPTAKITDEMYDELLKEFQKSIAIKEQADQLVIGTRPAAKKEESQIAESVDVLTEEPPAQKTQPAETPPPPQQKQTPQPPSEEPKDEDAQVPKEAPAEPGDEENEASRVKVKVVGKIDLGERLRNKAAAKKKASKPAKTEEKPESKDTKSEPTTKQETTIEAKEKNQNTSTEDKKVEPSKEAEQKEEQPPAKEKEDAPVIEEVVAEVKEEAPVKEEPTESPKPESEPPKKTTQESVPSGSSDKKVPEGQKAPEENQQGQEAPEKLVRAATPELRGLKILGKIDTDKFKKKKKKKEPAKDQKPTTNKTGKPGENAPKDKNTSSSSDDADKKKRKRRRRTVTVDNRSSSQGGGGGNRDNRSKGNRDNRDNRGRGNNSRKKDEPKEVSQKEIEEKIKATMARLSGGGKKKRQKLRRENRDRLKERQEQKEQEQQNDKLQLTEFVTVSELASLMNVDATDVIMTCMNLGVIVSINQRLEADIIELVAEEYGHEVEFISVEEESEDEDIFEDDPENLVPRAPIVTVMGHVDHGKTSLLDYIRSANVASGEAGGITQHIGAYEMFVGEDKRKITFLDTPGHEAFTAMRARGAKITDIAIIIIAADDSIMPQTKEAISHAQAAGVPIVFAINKVDKPNAQPDKIKQELASMNLLVEEWGGEHQSQDISAKTGQGIDSLLEKLLLEAEMLELKANPKREAIGTVIEASLDKGRGYVTKMLVQTGTLSIGVPIVAGEHSGKVKAMFNEFGKRIKTAGPSTPVLVLGLGGAPQAGDRFKQVESEQEARQIANRRAQITREQANRATKRISLDEIGRRLALGNFKELNLIVKGDVDGSVEALSDSMIKQSHETVQVNVIHKAVGQIIESDVLLASASDAIIIGFQVRPSLNARKLAEREGVEIKTYSIIYEAIEELKLAIEGMLEPTKEEKIVAQVEVRETFKISKIGTIAGCYVQEGKIQRNTHIRLIRDGIVIFPTKEGAKGEISSLKRFKDDVKEVKNGMECGISIKNYNDIKTGDIIEGYEIVEIKQTIS